MKRASYFLAFLALFVSGLIFMFFADWKVATAYVMMCISCFFFSLWLNTPKTKQPVFKNFNQRN